MEVTRVDRWIWAVRLCKTRSAATEACRAGHVKVNGATAKPATSVRPGDRVTARVFGRDHDVEVVSIIDKRVGAPLAIQCFVDHSPPYEPPPVRSEGPRPTKAERRSLERFRRRGYR